MSVQNFALLYSSFRTDGLRERENKAGCSIMCGIAGMYKKHGFGEVEQDQLADRMLQALAHRGPDDGGYAGDNLCFIGNRRLSIFDLSPNGNQPFFSPDGKTWLVLNGEIYNHTELRECLKGDYTFRSSTDTEVLLAAYLKWGIDCLTRCVGMFAFAIWDQHKQELILCRDPMGIKPLYYHETPDQFCFASECKAILATGIRAEMNEHVLQDYLVAGFYDHTDKTFFKDIQQVPAGCYLKISSGQVQKHRYWDPASVVCDDRHDGAMESYWQKLQESVHLRLRADVPYAVMLSGGLDSSIMAMLADAEIGSDQLQVCTFRSRDTRYDEGPWAALASAGKPWKQHEVTIDEKNVEDLLPETLWFQDLPFGGVASFADVLIAKKAREDGIIVLLEGQGADEMLGGYESYYPMYIADLLCKDERLAIHAYQEYAKRRGLPADVKTMRALVDRITGNTSIGQDGTLPVNRQCLAPALFETTVDDWKAPEPFSSRVHNSMYRDLFYTKVPRVLRFKDKASMMNGVELRVPFLDYRLVADAFAISLDKRFEDGYTKASLREKVAGMLPHDICFHVKRQVQTPQREWLRSLLRPFVEEVIHSGTFAERGWFDPSLVQSVYQDYCQHPDMFPNSFFIWQWLQVEWWMRIFVDRDWTPKEKSMRVARNKRRFPRQGERA